MVIQYLVIIVWGVGLLLPVLFLLYLKFTTPETPTTTNKTLKDREGYVIKRIKPGNISGKVKIKNSSKVWSATSNREIGRGKKVKVNEVEGVHLKVSEMIEADEELVELDRDLDEHKVCPGCETVITVYVKECPVCGEPLEEEFEDKGFFNFFNGIVSAIRGR